jgi:hypothetical protein
VVVALVGRVAMGMLVLIEVVLGKQQAAAVTLALVVLVVLQA